MLLLGSVASLAVSVLRRWIVHALRSLAQPRLIPLLLPPHGNNRLHPFLQRLVRLQLIQRLSQYLLCASILAVSEQLFHGADECFVEVTGERRSRVVAQYANEHYGVVLDMWSGRVLAGQELADLLCCSCGCGRGGFGGFDDDGKMENLLAAGGHAA